MKNSESLYHGHRFPVAVISCAVRWYFRFPLSLRDVEELLFERGFTSLRRGLFNVSTPLSPGILKGFEANGHAFQELGA